MNETLSTAEGRSVLRMERRLAHPPEKVWRALTEPAQLAKWFPSSVRLELRVGGRIEFDFPPDSPGVITALDPPRVFAFTWDRDVLHWEIRPIAEGSLLILTQTFDDRYGAPSFAAGWHTCVAALDGALSGAGRPTETSGMDELLEDYTKAFELDQGVEEETGVRFERQLSRPIPVVWATLGGDPAGERVPEGFAVAEFPPLSPAHAKAPHLLEYGTRGGRVRWELREGTGQGARLVLTHTCPPEDRATALATWRDHVERLAQRLLRTPGRSGGAA
ncbi:SRPBCC family protein [Sphaerisporangium viridialbum]|uniref:SRPBCC family protein n=1 Tax=Sphaerisporangium viridialbum TaxID=46189 RepID=UPI003C73D284